MIGGPRGRSRARWTRPTWLAALVVAIVAGLLVVLHVPSASGQRRLPALGPIRDVYDGDIGDPFILRVAGNQFVVFGTGDWPARVPTATSSDLEHWSAGPDAMPDLPPWAAPDPRNSFSWAPAVLATPSGYVLYISLREAGTGKECIGTAVSTIVTGPYRGGDAPLVCQRELGGSLDPSLVRTDDGDLHLLWKNDGNCCALPVSLWEQDLEPSGLALTGTPHRLLTSDREWQGGVIEEPSMTPAAGGGWWLFYSGNSFDRPEYTTGVAFCPTVAGPCRETAKKPLLATQGTLYAPGGLEVFTGPDGTLSVVFDTWNRPVRRDGRFHCCRSVQIASLRSA